MRVAAFQGPRQGLAVEERPMPQPRQREVVVKVGQCGICGTDVTFGKGEGFLQMPPGAVFGHEFAGEIVETGPGVERLAVGDHIAVLAIPCCGRCPNCVAGDPQWCTAADEDKLFGQSGGYAEYAPVAETQAVKVPGTLSWRDGALVEPMAVGLHGAKLAAFEPGTDMLVLGAGPIALATVYWARQMGAGRIVVQATSRRKERYARDLGADDFVVGGADPVAVAVEAMHGAPGLVIEAAGVPGSIEQAMQTVRPTGDVVVLGWCTVPDSYVPAIYLMKQVRLQFSMTYNVAEFERTIATLDGGAVEPGLMVSQTVSLDELPAVFDTLAGPTDQCKVIIDPWK